MNGITLHNDKDQLTSSLLNSAPNDDLLTLQGRLRYWEVVLGQHNEDSSPGGDKQGDSKTDVDEDEEGEEAFEEVASLPSSSFEDRQSPSNVLRYHDHETHDSSPQMPHTPSPRPGLLPSRQSVNESCQRSLDLSSDWTLLVEHGQNDEEEDEEEDWLPLRKIYVGYSEKDYLLFHHPIYSWYRCVRPSGLRYAWIRLWEDEEYDDEIHIE